jgi:Ca-activated chloride channel family protein
MKPDETDPRFTAYATGEMAPDDRSRFETELAKNPESRQLADGWVSLADFLAREMPKEPANPEPSHGILGPAHPATHNGALPTTRPKIVPFPELRRQWPWLAVAAALAMAFLVLPIILEDRQSSLAQASEARSNRVIVLPDLPAENPETLVAVQKQDLAPAQSADEGLKVAASTVPAPAAKPAELSTIAVLPPLPEPVVLPALPEGSEFAMADADPSENLEYLSTTPAKLEADAVDLAPPAPMSAPEAERERNPEPALASPAPPSSPELATSKRIEAPGSPYASEMGHRHAGGSHPSTSSGASLAGLETTAGKRSRMTSEEPPPGAYRSDELRRQTAATTTGAGESYDAFSDNPFERARPGKFSTFSLEVDTGSYTNVRRFVAAGQRPPRNAVRIEEMLNYFVYHDPPPSGDVPFAVRLDLAGSPWSPDLKLVRIGVKAKEIHEEIRPPANLVFLVDVSGSMDEQNKLPFVTSGLRLLTANLRSTDRVAIVTYAGESGLALDSTRADQKGREKIEASLKRLKAKGSTNGGAGIKQAYSVASEHFFESGVNRVVLCTDGDFNVGITDRGSLEELVANKARSNIHLSVFGFGTGNLKDGMMEALASKGNGAYGYIDSEREAERQFCRQLTGHLVPVAKDVKVQVDFNPERVAAYRLLGYENRLMAAADFNDDSKNAGEMGAGHSVTALYEIVPAGKPVPPPPHWRRVAAENRTVEPSKYAKDEHAASESVPFAKAFEIGEKLFEKAMRLDADGQHADAYRVYSATLHHYTELTPITNRENANRDARLRQVEERRTKLARALLAAGIDLAALKKELRHQGMDPDSLIHRPLKSDELLTVRVRYKEPDATVSTKLEFPLVDTDRHWKDASQDFQFAAAVAAFGMILRESPYQGNADTELVLRLARAGLGIDRDESRSGFIELVERYRKKSE